MHHHYLDEHSGIDSIIHRLDPRVKLASMAVFILFVVLTPNSAYAVFLLYGVIISIILGLSRIPGRYILKRFLTVIPFIIMATVSIPFMAQGGGETTGFSSGWMMLSGVLMKASLSLLCAVLFMNTMCFIDFLKALETFEIPRVVILVLSFMYRYIFVLQEELMWMWQAKTARSGKGAGWRDIKALANMTGMLFIRTYEKAETVYMAMCARGFGGEIQTVRHFKLRKADLLFLLSLCGLLTGIQVWLGGVWIKA